MPTKMNTAGTGGGKKVDRAKKSNLWKGMFSNGKSHGEKKSYYCHREKRT